MKRIVTLLLAAGLVMGAYTGAQAADVKVSGKWNFGFHFLDDNDYNTSEPDDTFEARQRLRLQMDIIASENLKGVIFFEIGQLWGGKDSADLGADDNVVVVKRSYIDWTIPSTDATVRMGVQGLALPGAVAGSPLFDDDVAGLTISNAFNDNFALTAFWARPFDGIDEPEGATNTPSSYNDEMDIFGLVAPITLDGHAITPYFVYSAIGQDCALPLVGAGFDSTTKKYSTGLSEDADAYWFGVAYTMTAFDPFTFAADFIYGDLDADTAEKFDGTSGWMVDFKAAYALDFMTPALLGWYATGADKDLDGIMPTIGSAACYYPTSFGFSGSCYYADTNLNDNPTGTWALGLEFADISFIEDLTHVFRVVYMEGTNDKDANLGDLKPGQMWLTEDDSAVEINFDSKYDIYENLAFILELGYINLDIERPVADDTAYKATFNFVYSF